MIDVLSKLGELGAVQLALIVVLVALALVARTVHRRRSLRPPRSASLDPSLPPALPRRRCGNCRRLDDGEPGWARSRGVALCPECLIKSYDGE